jgi:hypothetical protein
MLIEKSYTNAGMLKIALIAGFFARECLSCRRCQTAHFMLCLQRDLQADAFMLQVDVFMVNLSSRC